MSETKYALPCTLAKGTRGHPRNCQHNRPKWPIKGLAPLTLADVSPNPDIVPNTAEVSHDRLLQTLREFAAQDAEIRALQAELAAEKTAHLATLARLEASP